MFGVIKDYASRALGGIRSAGKSVGGFMKDYHAPILGALEGATGVLKKMDIPIVSGIAKVTHGGLKSLNKMIDDVPNEEAKEKLKEIAKSQSQTVTAPVTPSVTVLKDGSIIRGLQTKTGQGNADYGATDIKGKINPVQHNILNRSRIPYDLVRLQNKVI